MLLEINDLEKTYGPRAVVRLKRLALAAGDKVAVAGRNGAGKTTLLKMIAGEEAPDAGRIRLRGSVGVIPQFGGDARAQSGGERTQALIDLAFAAGPGLLLADEPTSNLDMEGIQRLEARLCAFRGALLLVSHDRALLEAVCGKVLDIETGTLYGCGYRDYLAQKRLEAAAAEARYEAYTAEKGRLAKAAEDTARRSARVKRTPKRMGNSEARLHRMGGQGAKARLDGAARAARSRLAQLEPVEKPFRGKGVVFDLRADALHSAVLVSVRGAAKAFGGRQVLRDCSFDVPGGKKTALLGANGAGKTTLMEMIAAREAGVHPCARLKIGYFKQDISTLDMRKSVLGNAMAASAYDECFSRTVLARLHFGRDGLDRQAAVLSGGERLKLALACIILSGFNLLMLDEPTNFLDAEGRGALEAVLAAYPDAVLFASHDRAFVEAVADRIVYISDGCAHTFEGGWQAYVRARHGG